MRVGVDGKRLRDILFPLRSLKIHIRVAPYPWSMHNIDGTVSAMDAACNVATRKGS